MTDLINPDGVVDRLTTDFLDTLMNTYSKQGEGGMKKQIDDGLKYWESKYQAAAVKFKNSGGLLGSGDYHRSENLYKAFVRAGNDALDRVEQLKADESVRKEKESEDKKRAEAQKRQAAAAAAYAALTKKEMSERIAIKKKYHEGEIATEEEFNAQLLQLNISALQRRLNSGQLKGKERLEIEEQLTTLLLQQKKEEQEKLDRIEAERIKAIPDATEREIAAYALRCQKYKGNAQMLEQLNAQHARNLAKIQLDKINTAIKAEEDSYNQARQNLKNQQASELLSFTGTASEKKKIRKQHLEELAQLDTEHATNMAKKLQELLDNGSFGDLSLDSALLSDEEKNKLTQKLLEVKGLLVSLGLEMENIRGVKLNAIGTKDLLGFSLDDWSTLFSNLELTGDKWEKMEQKVQRVAMVLKAMTEVYATYDKFATAAESRQLNQFKKNNDAKKKDLDRRLDLGLMSQDDYNARCAQMDEEYAAKEDEIQLKQARRQKAISIAEAIINTAVGVTKALPNFVLAAIVGLMGATQVALIASQPIGGAEEGGMLVTRAQDGKKFKATIEPSKRGYVEKPTVITGENGLEYVIPNEAMRNPTARPVIDLFETVRKQGRLSDFNFDEVLPALYGVPGRASGGRVSSSAPMRTDSAGGSLPFIEGTDDTKRILACLEYLCEKADTPIPAVVSILGQNGFESKYAEFLRMKKLGQLGKP